MAKMEAGAEKGAFLEQVWEGEEVRASGGRHWTWERSLTHEEELRTLQALALYDLLPGLGWDVETIFEEAVSDSLTNLLGDSEARALMTMVRRTDFSSPQAVFAELDSILGEGSRILKRAISREFRTNVHLLLEKVERNLLATLELSGAGQAERSTRPGTGRSAALQTDP